MKKLLGLIIAFVIYLSLIPQVRASTEELYTVNVNTNKLVSDRNNSYLPFEIKNFTADETGIYIPNVRTMTKFDHQMNKLWDYTGEYPTATNGFSSPVKVDGNEIYIVGTPSDIYKIDKTTGELIEHLTISGFSPSPWYYNPPIINGEKIIVWGNGQICVLNKTPITKINCKTVTPWMSLDFKYYIYETGGLIGKTNIANVNSYKINKLEENGLNDYTNWQSFKTAENSQANTNIAESTDREGNIYYLSGSRYGADEPDTVYLTKLNAGNGDILGTQSVKTYGTNHLAFETLQIDKINNTAYFMLNDKDPATENSKEYRKLYVIDLDKSEDYIKYTYSFEPNTYTNKNIILHNQKLYINNSKQLYIFDQNGFYTKLNIGYKLMGTPQITKNEKQEYIFYAHTTALTEEYNTHRFIGIKVENLKYCPTGLYCENTPKHNPVIFVHGFGGYPEEWDTGEKKAYKERILELYRQDDPEFPEEWLVSYSYGYDINGKYDYQGRIENISAGMNQLVPFLSNEHKYYGGDGKVDIVAYSLGGIVSRNYLYNNSEDHHINKLITIASPHQGVDWLNYEVNVRNCTFVQCFGRSNILKSTAQYFLNKRREPGREISLLSTPVSQLTRSGNQYYLDKLTSNITGISGYTLYGNIALKTEYRLFGVKIHKELSVGDGLVLTHSAKELPEISNEQATEYFDGITISPQILMVNGMYELNFDIPNILDNKYSHELIPLQTEVIDDVINILTNEE